MKTSSLKKYLLFPLEVAAGRINQKDITYLSAALVKGKVVRYVFDTALPTDSLFGLEARGIDTAETKESTFTPKEPLPKATIRLECQTHEEIYQMLTDSAGEFHFPSLRPGKWKVTLYYNNMPEHTYFEKTSYVIDIAPGQEEDIEFKLLPKRRSIQFLD